MVVYLLSPKAPGTVPRATKMSGFTKKWRGLIYRGSSLVWADQPVTRLAVLRD